MAEKVRNIAQENIVDVDLSVIAKKKFRINGDESRILELNTSDLGIMSRIKEAYPKLMELQDEVVNIGNVDTEDEIESISQIGDKLASVDMKMRDLLDFIFDSNVAEVCGKEGSMYDPVGGMFRYEHILDTLTKLYEKDINHEFNAMRTRVEKHTKKYHK